LKRRNIGITTAPDIIVAQRTTTTTTTTTVDLDRAGSRFGKTKSSLLRRRLSQQRQALLSGAGKIG
jgi:hypothetical protein